MQDVWVALLVAEVQSLIIFVRNLMLFNRIREPVNAPRMVSLATSLTSGAGFWVALNSVHRPVWFQFASGLLSTASFFTSMLLMVNDSFRLPTRQQGISLFLYASTDTFFLLQTRLIFA